MDSALKAPGKKVLALREIMPCHRCICGWKRSRVRQGIRKVCRGLRYLAYKTFCSSTTFEGKGEGATSKTLGSKYEAVLQKIGLECIEFSVKLQKFRYGSGFTTQIPAIYFKNY